MGKVTIEIPEDIILEAKIPKKNVKDTLKKELAVVLYKDEILSFGAARRLAGMEKLDFHFLLGEKNIERQYDIEEYQEDIKNIDKWLKEEK